MFAGMSAYPSISGSTRADSWPVAKTMAGLSAVPVGHAIDLATLFPMQGQERHEALIVETRRHLGGCLTAIETALRLLIAPGSHAALALAPYPDPLCWGIVSAHPSLIGPALLLHMRMRAGVALMLRQFGRPNSDLPDSIEAGDLLPGHDPQVADAASMLALAEGRWSAAGAEEQALRPDLPAEQFAELLWTAIACLTSVVERSTAPAPNGAVLDLEQAGHALLAQHDEGAGAIAAADRLVLQLGVRADEPELLGRALAQRRFLLFAALAGRRARLSTGVVVDILLSGPVSEIAALCRTLGGSDADYRHLLLALRPVRPMLTDATIVTEAERYEALEEAQADGEIRALRAPIALRVKLDHLRRVTGR